jgi:glycine cleavage system H protein
MAVIFMLVTFLAFALIDWIVSRGKVPAIAPSEAEPKAVSPALDPSYVEGFLVPGVVQYHPGHAWAASTGHHLQRVGVDEFAAALAGRVEKIELPKPGQWVRQGQRAWSMFRNGEKTEMVSPAEGEVVEVNPEVLANPALVRNDPYGKGWLFTIQVPDEENTARNLVPKSMVSSWMRDAVQRLYAVQPQLAGAVAADGGRPAEDLLADLPNVSWHDVTGEFFLTR